MTDTNSAASSGMCERIVRAAYECFDRFGISKTTIEDIASRARVSRPSVYKYFSGKDDIVDRICHDEAVKVNAEVRRRLVRTDKFDTMVTEAILVVIRVASDNQYIRRTIEDAKYQADAIESTSTVHRIHRELWGRFFEHARETGELASDINIDDIITWLNMSQLVLLMRLGIAEQTDDQLRHFIRRFVVDPLLSDRYPRAAPANAVEGPQKKRRPGKAA